MAARLLDVLHYSGTYEQETHWRQYKFTSFVLYKDLGGCQCIETIGKTTFLGPCTVSLVERLFILCPFLGGSTIGDFTVMRCFVIIYFACFCRYTSP